MIFDDEWKLSERGFAGLAGYWDTGAGQTF